MTIMYRSVVEDILDQMQIIGMVGDDLLYHCIGQTRLINLFA
jgi:hypothetical protein